MRRPKDRPHAPLWRRLTWFALLWVAGVLAVTLLALVLRLWI